ncbi:MAG: kanamycin nucleotidyltransferase C-terminal domain-containing protein [Chloroflexota bacterium]
MNIFEGPQPQNNDARKAILDRIVADLQTIYAEQIIAIGLYGSMARESDMPYSDVELCCVIQGEEIDHNYEWVYGASKAEVNVRSPDALRDEVLDLDESWAIWKGAYLDMRTIYGDAALFAEMSTLVLSPATDDFDDVVAGMIVGELYEWIGKLRNAQHVGNLAILPQLASKFVEYGALMLGLVHRHCYTTGSQMLEESLQLPDRPDGYDELCALVMVGTLAEPEKVAAKIETFWQGVGRWTAANDIDLSAWSGWPLQSTQF